MLFGKVYIFFPQILYDSWLGVESGMELNPNSFLGDKMI